MVVWAAFFLAATVIQVPTVQVVAPADFTISVNDGEVPIHCEVNDRETLLTQDLIDRADKQVSLLKARLFLNLITPEQNQELFDGELLLSELTQIRAAHNFATYFCKHPEALPKVHVQSGV
jgi:hypothetical protein